MNQYTVSIQIIRVYHLDVSAQTEEEATSMVLDMTTEELAEQGSLKLVETDFAEVLY